MPIKRTIGIIDATQKMGTEIAAKLANTDCRLLLISDNVGKLKLLTEDMMAQKSMAEIDFVECAKEGCWEADVIILTISKQGRKSIAEKMKAVAIQKIVVSISDERNSTNSLQSLLPYSKLINIYWNYPSKEMEIFGKDDDALQEISNIFQQAGFSVKPGLDVAFAGNIY